MDALLDESCSVEISEDKVISSLSLSFILKFDGIYVFALHFSYQI